MIVHFVKVSKNASLSNFLCFQVIKVRSWSTKLLKIFSKFEVNEKQKEHDPSVIIDAFHLSDNISKNSGQETK